MAKIVTVYSGAERKFVPAEMSYILWLKTSEAMARRGHRVDIAAREPGFFRRRFSVPIAKDLRRVPLPKVRWNDYDVVMTLFHSGFETLERRGGAAHPYIISILGSVVQASDRPGIYFHGQAREHLYVVQEKIQQTSKYIAIWTKPSKDAWLSCFGPKDNILLVPGAAEASIPAPRRDPYPLDSRKKCLFAANVYTAKEQPEANRVLIQKVNRLAKILSGRGIAFYFMGVGDTRDLDLNSVTHLGMVNYEKTWDYFHHADVGIVLALGSHPNDNESTKIYHYLRAGLPVVCESGFPNEDIVKQAGLGFVTENGNMELMAQKIEEAATRDWNRSKAIDLILARHTWDHRAGVYDEVIKKDFASA